MTLGLGMLLDLIHHRSTVPVGDVLSVIFVGDVLSVMSCR